MEGAVFRQTGPVASVIMKPVASVTMEPVVSVTTVGAVVTAARDPRSEGRGLGEHLGLTSSSCLPWIERHSAIVQVTVFLVLIRHLTWGKTCHTFLFSTRQDNARTVELGHDHRDIKTSPILRDMFPK